MKILLITLEYPPFKGGVANYYENVVKYWPEKNEIFVLNNNKLIKNWIYPKWMPAISQLWRAVTRQAIKYVLVGHILPLGTVAWLLSGLLKFKYSVILHGMDFTFACRTARKRWLTARILGKAEKIICANSCVAGLVKEFLGAGQSSKVVVVNPGIIEHRTWNIEHGTKLTIKYNLENKIILFSIGRLVKRKGVDMVIKSMPKVLEKVQNLVYIIAGVGSDEEYLKNIRRNAPRHVLTNIIFLGKISEEEKWNWLNLCDIFITPSRNINGDFEGFGIVYLEANLAGKPVIAGDSGGVRDAVENGVNGLLVNPGDKNEIANTIIKLAKDEMLRKKLGEQGRGRAVGEFNWEKQIRLIYSAITNNS